MKYNSKNGVYIIMSIYSISTYSFTCGLYIPHETLLLRSEGMKEDRQLNTRI
jgi:hypothetical protein